MTFSQLLVGSFKLYFTDFFMANGVILVCLAPILILMLSGYAIMVLILYLLLAFLLIGVMMVPLLLVCHHTFDRVINKKDYPAFYGRGLSYGEYALSENGIFNDKGCDFVDENGAKTFIENDFERVIDEDN
jgi:hypothetical protein